MGTIYNTTLPTLLDQPSKPRGKITLIECRGGSDKNADGHRGDTIPICNAIIKLGWQCKPIFYCDKDYKMVEKEILSSQGYICRVNPGTYEGVTQSKLNTLLNEAVRKGIKGMSSPESMKKMGAKDALVRIRNLRCGLRDTNAYYTLKELEEGFSRSMAGGNMRVLKQNRGSQGEGIWEAVDNHKEEKTLAEFTKFCNKYLEGDEGQLVDQRFLPRIKEGEVRALMIGDNPIELIHKKPACGGISATLKSGAEYVRYAPTDQKFALLMEYFKEDLPKLMNALDIGEELPLIWTVDFIPGPKKGGHDTFLVGEFNCSCVGITKQLDLASLVGKTAITICSGGQALIGSEKHY